MRKQLLISLAALLISASVMAKHEMRGVAIHAAQNETSRTIKGRIIGDETADYIIKVAAGQTLTIDLKTSNTSSYFNITARGASEALFVGSVSGNAYEGVIPAKGAYTIRVYMMRNAARRDEVAEYTLNINVKSAQDSHGKQTINKKARMPSDEMCAFFMQSRLVEIHACELFPVVRRPYSAQLQSTHDSPAAEGKY